MAHQSMVRVADQYPPSVPETATKIVDEVATPERDASGNYVLRRSLTQADVTALRAGRDLMRPWLARSRQNDVADVIAQTFAGFAGNASEQEAAVKASTFALALTIFPLWAIKRACLRFARNEVRDEELGKDQTWNRTWGPTSAHVATIAREIAAPTFRAVRRIERTLSGTPARLDKQITEDQRAELAERMQRTVDAMTQRVDPAAAVRAEAAERFAGRMAEARIGWTRDQYEAAGLEMPVDGGIPISLSLRQALGQRVETGPDGHPVLTGKARPRGWEAKR